MPHCSSRPTAREDDGATERNALPPTLCLYLSLFLSLSPRRSLPLIDATSRAVLREALRILQESLEGQRSLGPSMSP